MVTIPKTYMDVEIYDVADPTRRLGTIPFYYDAAFVDDLPDSGGSFKLRRTDPKILQNSALLNDRNVAKCKINNEVVAAFVMARRRATTIDSGEVSTEAFQFSGPGLRSWFESAVVYAAAGSSETRAFNFAAPRGDWYVPASWVPPVNIQSKSLTDITLPWGTAPAEWPDAPDAKWVWGSFNDDASPAPIGLNYFRSEVTVSDFTGAGEYALFVSGNDQFQVFVDGILVIEATEANPEAKTWRADFTLEPGPHIIAARVLNTGGKAAFIASFFRAGNAVLNTAAQLLGYTGDGSSWLVNAYPAQAPGWSVGEILLRLLTEAEARGVRFPLWLTPTFTTSLDSDGNPWPEALDWEFEVGSDLTEVLDKLEEVGFEIWINPDTYKLNMAPSRGTNRATGGVGTIKFEAGKNLLLADEDTVSSIKNILLVQSNEGWFEVATQDVDSLSKYGRQEGFVSTNSSGSISSAAAASALSLKSQPETSSSYKILATTDTQPFKKVFPGDWTLAPDSTGSLVPRRIMSISVTRDNNSGAVAYEAEFDTIFEDAEDRATKRLARLDRGSLGGAVANSSGGLASAGGSGFNVPLANSQTTVYGGDSGLIGEVRWGTWTSTPNPQWRIANGQEVDRVTYATYFAQVGTTFGAGNGDTTFNIPNLLGRVAVGVDPADPLMDAVGETGGTKVHSHGLAAGYTKLGLAAGANPALAASRRTVPSYTETNRYSLTASSSSVSGTTSGLDLGGTTDDGTSYPPFMALTPIIKIA